MVFSLFGLVCFGLVWWIDRWRGGLLRMGPAARPRVIFYCDYVSLCCFASSSLGITGKRFFIHDDR